mmetsp:Transcript_41/g.191  ORF Transcript_41/g.191 Transcript_41/m.191 type:complete len:206 (+) Transcript_41:1370-1987(+)
MDAVRLVAGLWRRAGRGAGRLEELRAACQELAELFFDGLLAALDFLELLLQALIGLGELLLHDVCRPLADSLGIRGQDLVSGFRQLFDLALELFGELARDAAVGRAIPAEEAFAFRVVLPGANALHEHLQHVDNPLKELLVAVAHRRLEGHGELIQLFHRVQGRGHEHVSDAQRLSLAVQKQDDFLDCVTEGHVHGLVFQGERDA